MITLYYYDAELKKSDSIEELKRIAKNKDITFWLDIYDAEDEEIMDILGGVFNFHPLTVDDCLGFTPHPKIDEYEDYIFVILHSLNYYECENRISTRELDTYLGKNFLITYHYKTIECISSLEKKILKDNKLMLKGSDMLYYFLLDKLFDKYFLILEEMDKKIETIEDEIFSFDTKHINQILTKINTLKKNNLLMRKIIVPQIKAIKDLVNETDNFISEKNKVYYKDIHYHLNRVSDMIDVNLDLIRGTFDTFSSLLTNKANEIMRMLTIIATLMMPLTFIAGVYGMNFRHMPELEWKYGYVWALGIMLSVALFMIFWMRKRKWF